MNTSSQPGGLLIEAAQVVLDLLLELLGLRKALPQPRQVRSQRLIRTGTKQKRKHIILQHVVPSEKQTGTCFRDSWHLFVNLLYFPGRKGRTNPRLLPCTADGGPHVRRLAPSADDLQDVRALWFVRVCEGTQVCCMFGLQVAWKKSNRWHPAASGEISQ